MDTNVLIQKISKELLKNGLEQNYIQIKEILLVENIKLVAEIKITKLKYFSLILILKLLKNDTTTKT